MKTAVTALKTPVYPTVLLRLMSCRDLMNLIPIVTVTSIVMIVMPIVDLHMLTVTMMYIMTMMLMIKMNSTVTAKKSKLPCSTLMKSMVMVNVAY